MANNEVALIIGATELCRMADGGLFEIKGVQVHVSIHALNARHTCEVAQLVGIGRIHHKGGLATFHGKFVGNLGSQLRRVPNAIRTDAGMLEHNLVDGIRTTGQRKQATAATDKCIKVLEL